VQVIARNREETKMTKLKLTYFDFDGGRGEPARLALHIGGIPFEDERVNPKDWPQFRDRTPFQALPTLEVDGKVVAQSNTINRYVGKLAGLYPQDDWQAVLCDEAMDAARTSGPGLPTQSTCPWMPRSRRAQSWRPDASRATWSSCKPG